MASPDRVRRFGWIAALAAALALWASDASGRREILESANSYGRTPAPARDAASPTGFAFSQRTQLQLSADGYHWAMQAQQQAADGGLRVREVGYDNAPEGRATHWSSPLRWWIVLLAHFESARTGAPHGVAIERASIVAGPWLLAALAVVLTPLVARRFGALAAATFAVGLICVAPVSSAFAVGAVDHHGLAAVAALLSALLLAAAAGVANPKVWVGASGVVGGVGLWISASTQVPVLVGLGLGAVAGAWLGRSQAEGIPPRLWRTWGVVGGITSLMACLVEYFPAHLGWRLEVNHPLYALAWMGAGEILHRLARAFRGESFWGRRAERWLATAAVGALLLLPVVVVATGRDTFWVSDPLLWSIHTNWIEEFAPLMSEFRRPDGLPAIVVLLLVVTILPAIAVPVVWAAWRRDTSPATRVALWLVVAPAIVTFLLALAQKRWLHVTGGLWLATFVVFVAAVAAGQLAQWRSPARRWMIGVFAALVLLPFPIAAVRQRVALATTGPEVGPGEMRELAARDAARWLRRRTGAEGAVVLSDFSSTTQLVYFGGFRGIGTLYWENLPGLRAAVRAAGSNPVAAERVFRERGITHVVTVSWQNFDRQSAVLAGEDEGGRGLFQELAAGRIPAWLRPLGYRLPEHPAYAGEAVTVYEVAFDQTPADARVAEVRYRLSKGEPPAALLASLREFPDHLPALCTLAQAFLARRDAAGLDSVWPRILAELRRDAVIDPDDRLVIIQCFLAANRRGDAAAQLERLWKSADERALRRLSPGALALAVRLSAELGVMLPAESAAWVERLREAPAPP